MAIPHQIAQTITLIERCLSRAINLYRAWETEHAAVVMAKPPHEQAYKRMQANEGEQIDLHL